MRKQLAFACAALGVLVSAALLPCRDAAANGTLAVTLADYNSAQVGANGNVVTVPYGNTLSGTYYQALYTLTSGTQLEINSLFTVTLPTGFTFATTPSLCAFSGSCTYASLNAGGVGSQSATFQITSTVASGVGVYLYPGFQMHTPAAFATQFSGSSYSISVQAHGNATPANNDASPVAQPAFNHAVGSLPNTSAVGGGQINLAFPFHGNQFVPGGNDGKTIQGSGSVATFSIVTEANDPFNSNALVLNAAGGLNSLAPGDTANITVSGYFNGIGSAYAYATAGACQITKPASAVAGTVSTSSITFAGIPINTPVQICIIPNGVMWANNQPYVFSYSAGTGVTDFFGGLSQTTANNFFLYSTTPTLTVIAGTPQYAPVNSAFGTGMQVQVLDPAAGNAPLVGIDVLFTSPAPYLGGPTGTFSGSYNSTGAGTDGSGMATAPTFTANSVACNYVVNASVGGASAPFHLANEPVGITDLLFCNGFQH